MLNGGFDRKRFAQHETNPFAKFGGDRNDLVRELFDRLSAGAPGKVLRSFMKKDEGE